MEKLTNKLLLKIIQIWMKNRKKTVKIQIKIKKIATN